MNGCTLGTVSTTIAHQYDGLQMDARFCCGITILSDVSLSTLLGTKLRRLEASLASLLTITTGQWMVNQSGSRPRKTIYPKPRRKTTKQTASIKPIWMDVRGIWSGPLRTSDGSLRLQTDATLPAWWVVNRLNASATHRQSGYSIRIPSSR